jgi:RNA polymerase sigma factor (sigma-70 family)
VAERLAIPEQLFLRDVFVNEVPDETLMAILAAESMRRHLRRRIEEALRALSYRDRGILQMRYGLGDGHTYTLAEVGHVFQLTRERIRQLQSKALRRFRRQADDLRKLLCTVDN